MMRCLRYNNNGKSYKGCNNIVSYEYLDAEDMSAYFAECLLLHREDKTTSFTDAGASTCVSVSQYTKY